MKATLIKRSIECGGGEIKDEIPLGFVYDVDPTSIRIDFLEEPETLKVFAIPKIYIEKAGTNEEGGYLPLELLRLEPTTKEALEAEMFSRMVEDAVQTQVDPKEMN